MKSGPTLKGATRRPRRFRHSMIPRVMVVLPDPLWVPAMMIDFIQYPLDSAVQQLDDGLPVGEMVYYIETAVILIDVEQGGKGRAHGVQKDHPVCPAVGNHQDIFP